MHVMTSKDTNGSVATPLFNPKCTHDVDCSSFVTNTTSTRPIRSLCIQGKLQCVLKKSFHSASSSDQHWTYFRLKWISRPKNKRRFGKIWQKQKTHN